MNLGQPGIAILLLQRYAELEDNTLFSFFYNSEGKIPFGS
jgi:hypothetical protein